MHNGPSKRLSVQGVTGSCHHISVQCHGILLVILMLKENISFACISFKPVKLAASLRSFHGRWEIVIDVSGTMPVLSKVIENLFFTSMPETPLQILLQC